MAESKQITIKAILNDAKKLKESLKLLKEQISSLRDTSGFKNIYTLKSLLEDYNSLRNHFLSILKESNLYNVLPYISLDFLYLKPVIGPASPSLKLYLSQSDIDMALSMVEKAERGCFIIISVCESLLKPKVPQESLDRLHQLWDEVKRVEKELPREKGFLVINLRKALGEYEQGHFLASALIASRVITYVLEKIPIPEEAQKIKKAQSSLAELKVKTLIERGVVDKNRKDEQEGFLKFSKEARNLLSHKAYIFPEIEEVLILIASAITFCKYLIRLGLINDDVS